MSIEVKMAKLPLLVGLPASGKTTRAHQIKSENPNSIIVSRDKLREMLHGYCEADIATYYSRSDIGVCEKQITKIQDDIIREALLDGKDVIVDNTNLKLRDINHFVNFQAPIYFEVLDVPVYECIQRDKKRVRKVGEQVIQKKFADFCQLKKVCDFQPIIPKLEPIIQDTSLRRAMVFDIDGTLAIKGNRSPYEWNKVGLDSVNKDIR